MWESEANEYAPIREAELELLSSSARHDRKRLAVILSPDFAEIGRSGRRWTRDEIVASLGGEAIRDAPITSDWLFNRVGPNLVLVNYIIHQDGYESRHCSLWEMPGPVLRYHQGTPIPVR
ncbi:DUF4440 domain-containing protein [Frondihabitans sp. PAMC 28766]|uniref:nuclear transport factor 2 family protein n=1 Tax=Frondihabitans sp. PAMC 28766 TaxID=1795630 RepID=UPI0009EBF1B0|nr:nuclear transport factor 2 family protein [Frondihabitans sp. PAMC 28766]